MQLQVQMHGSYQCYMLASICVMTFNVGQLSVLYASNYTFKDVKYILSN